MIYFVAMYEMSTSIGWMIAPGGAFGVSLLTLSNVVILSLSSLEGSNSLHSRCLTNTLESRYPVSSLSVSGTWYILTQEKSAS